MRLFWLVGCALVGIAMALIWASVMRVHITVTNCTGIIHCMQEGPKEIMRKGADGTIEIEI